MKRPVLNTSFWLVITEPRTSESGCAGKARTHRRELFKSTYAGARGRHRQFCDCTFDEPLRHSHGYRSVGSMPSQVQGNAAGKVAQAWRRGCHLRIGRSRLCTVWMSFTTSATARQLRRSIQSPSSIGGTLVIKTDSEEDLAGRIPLTRHFPDTVQGELERYPRIETLHEELDRAGFVDIENDHAHAQ